jgi:cytoskeleton protein RodZ
LRGTRRPAAPKVVSLRLTARQVVYVCVVDARGRRVVNGVTLQPGKSTKTLRSSRFRVNLGNANLKLTANGKTYPVAGTGSPVGYELRPGTAPKRLADSVRAGLCR